MANLKVVDAEQLEADLTSVADSIRAKTDGEEKLAFPSGYMSALDTIQSADSVYEEIEYKLTEGYKYYDYYFTRRRFTTIPMEMIRFIQNALGASHICEYCQYLVEFPSLTLLNESQLASAFNSCGVLEKVGVLNTPLVISFASCFSGCRKLHTIEGVDFSSARAVKYAFANCPELVNLTFNGVIKVTDLDLSSCTKLTHDSLMSAINALLDHKTAGTSGTFKLILGTTNLAKLTDAEKAIATQRGWTLA